MKHKKSEITDKIIFTVKIAVGSCISIVLAEYMGLDFVSSAGIITLLTILTTKWATVKLAFNRILSFIVTVCISKIAFGVSDINWMNYCLFLLLLCLQHKMHSIYVRIFLYYSDVKYKQHRPHHYTKLFLYSLEI